MFKLFIRAYPWDLEGADALTMLDRLQGEVGISGLSVWTAAGSVTQLRVGDVDPKIYRTRGGLLFVPTAEYYSRTRCKPVLATRLPVRYSISAIGAACAARSLEIRGIVSASRVGRLADRYPEFSCRSVLGLESRRSLCLSNGDVQSYLVGLIAELTERHALRTIVLSDYFIAWSDAFDPHLESTLPLNSLSRAVLSICFCDSCRRASTDAGVDVAQAELNAKNIIQRAVETGAGEGISVSGLLAENPALGAHVGRQLAALDTLLQQIRERSTCSVLLSGSALTQAAPGACGIDGVRADGFITPCIDGSDRVPGSKNPPRHLEWLAPAGAAVGERAAQLVSTFHEAAKQGFEGVEVDNLGVLPHAAFDGLRQALRFARRGA
ncbi:MAG: hypothetical protein HY287_11780 [Planctomycetes bacterium]|nr:hypothetical protein [Planctomycetota bacterium]